MRRLSEEVRGRLEEMALITSRTLGTSLTKDTVRKFVPVEQAADKAHVTHVEIVDIPTGHMVATPNSMTVALFVSPAERPLLSGLDPTC